MPHSLKPIRESMGRRNLPFPVDPVPPEMTKDVKAVTPGKDESASTAAEKRMTREERKDGKTRRSKDGTWTKKNNASHFGNKLHTVQGICGNHGIIA